MGEFDLLLVSPSRPFESTNGPSTYRHWNVNEPSACSRRSESSGLFIELPEPRAWPGGVGVQKNHTAGAGPRYEACVSEKGIGSWSKSSQERTWTGVSHTRTVPTRRTRELYTAKPSPLLSRSHRLWEAPCARPPLHEKELSEMETATITTTQTAFAFGLTERRTGLSLHAPAQDCAVPAAHPGASAAAYQSKAKVLKRQRSSSPELLRCKRRLSFNGLGYSIPQQQPVAVARRNERERNRVKQVNMGFQTLRQHVPNGAANKKMSKVETLRSAVEYIRALQQLLDEHDAVSAAFQCGLPSPTLSNSYSADPESPHSTYSSDEGGYEPLSSEEQELLDFTTWFDRDSPEVSPLCNLPSLLPLPTDCFVNAATFCAWVSYRGEDQARCGVDLVGLSSGAQTMPVQDYPPRDKVCDYHEKTASSSPIAKDCQACWRAHICGGHSLMALQPGPSVLQSPPSNQPT
ncbi:hypothetical protein L3Q82_007316 [Scortum barcoo]|uniref:Uncharacterized protein n=1 Tax=Scortum barcoo TaxID=214431 RepID=A0ACB8WSK7_9TELE|nr:hypothetical protein L3Q82_007316 [Scortum barcoo]